MSISKLSFLPQDIIKVYGGLKGDNTVVDAALRLFPHR